MDRPAAVPARDELLHAAARPEAQQLATYVGWLLHGTRGGLVAGGLFVLPGVVALLGLSAVYVAFGSTTAVLALFAGLAPAVVAIVAQAVVRVAKKALDSAALIAIAVAAFLALALFGVPFPLVVGLAGVAGWALGRWRPSALPRRGAGEAADAGPPPVISDDVLHTEPPTARRTLKVLLVGLLLWGLPVAAVAVLTGAGSVFTEQGLFRRGRRRHLRRRVRGAGLRRPAGGRRVRLAGAGGDGPRPGAGRDDARTAHHGRAVRRLPRGLPRPGALDPWTSAVLASLLVTWVTFVPSFLFVLLGAPFMERLRGNRSLSAALTGITAAVVGVIANLGVYFTVHTLFSDSVRLDRWVLDLELPDLATLRPLAAGIAAVAAVLLFRLRWSVLRALGLCAALGLVAGLAGLPVS